MLDLANDIRSLSDFKRWFGMAHFEVVWAQS